MTFSCRRLVFLGLTLLVTSRAPAAAQGGTPTPGGVQPAGPPAPAPPAGGQSGAPQPAPAPPATEHAPPPPPVPVAASDAPPGPFAIDVRYAMPSYNTGSALADPLGFRTDQLPGRGCRSTPMPQSGSHGKTPRSSAQVSWKAGTENASGRS